MGDATAADHRPSWFEEFDFNASAFGSNPPLPFQLAQRSSVEEVRFASIRSPARQRVARSPEIGSF